MANTIQFLEPINVEGSMSIDGVSLGTAAFSNQTIPTNNNQLLNGAGYITSGSLPTVSNATITIAAGTGLSGGSTFTLNQAISGQTIKDIPLIRVLQLLLMLRLLQIKEET